MKRRHLLAIALVSMVAFSSAAAVAQEKLISERVFYVHDPKATTVSFHLLVRAGCNDEANMQCKGLAHYLEHLVLTGRNAENKGEALRFFPDGLSNGSTTDRRTTFDHSFPANAADVEARLNRLFAFYAARLKGFEVTPEVAERERKIVTQERNWRLSYNAYAIPAQEANKFLYQGHPEGDYVGGNPELIAGYNVKDAHTFHDRWYRMSNAYFIVSGPISETLVKKVAEANLASLDRSPPPERPWLTKKPDMSPAIKRIEASDARIDSYYVNLRKIAPIGMARVARTRAVMRVLNEFIVSQVQKSPSSELVENSDVAAHVISAVVNLPMPGVMDFSFMLEPAKGVSPAQLEQAMRDYLTKLAATGIDEKMTERLKKRVKTKLNQDVALPETAAGRLLDWLDEEMTYDEVKAWPETVGNVTSAEINELLRAMAGPGREVVINYSPKSAN